MTGAAGRAWYLNTAEGAAGPYTVAEIQGWIAEGRISDEWHVWRDGEPAWATIRESAAFQAASDPAAPSERELAPSFQRNGVEQESRPEKAAAARPAASAAPAGPGFFQRLILAAAGILYGVRTGIEWTTSTLGKLIYPAFILMIVGGLGYAQVNVWKTPREFRSPGGYSVVLPGFYSKVSTENQDAGGVRIVAHEAIGGGTLVDLLNAAIPIHRLIDYLSQAGIVPPIRLFGMAHLELPSGAVTRANRDEFLSSMASEFVKAYQGEVIESREIATGRYPGRETAFSGTYDGTKIFGRLQCYLVKNKVVILAFVGLAREVIGHPEGEAFFQSLKIDV